MERYEQEEKRLARRSEDPCSDIGLGLSESRHQNVGTGIECLLLVLAVDIAVFTSAPLRDYIEPVSYD